MCRFGRFRSGTSPTTRWAHCHTPHGATIVMLSVTKLVSRSSWAQPGVRPDAPPALHPQPATDRPRRVRLRTVARRLCAGCATLIPEGISHCPACETTRGAIPQPASANRGGAPTNRGHSSPGYGAAHRRETTRWKPHAHAGLVDCASLCADNPSLRPVQQCGLGRNGAGPLAEVATDLAAGSQRVEPPRTAGRGTVMG